MIVVVLTRLVSTNSKITHCCKCGSSKTKLYYRNPIISEDTIIIKKYQNWAKGMCLNCYNKHISNPIHKTNNPRRLRFKDKRILLKESPRIGVCSNCRAIVGQINAQLGILCRRTEMNHFKYHPSDPLKDAMEMCNPCHRHSHKQLRAGGGA